jgi:hypothetical protein
MATAMNVSAWSTTAASNDGADSTIGTVANTSAPNTVDDWVRGVMASVKRYANDIGGAITAGGTADVITLTTNRVISSGHQAAGFSLRFKAGGTNTGAVTVNVDGLGAKSVKRPNGDALSAGDIVSGGIYDISYDGTNYQLIGAVPPASGSFSAAISVSAASPAISFTDTDTGADCNVSAASSAGSLTLNADTNDEVAGSKINFNVDGALVAALDENGAFDITTIELGHASDTTLARSAAGTVTVEGNTLCRIKTGTYTGDGSTSKAITTGFTPKYVRVWPRETSSGTGAMEIIETTAEILDDHANGGSFMIATTGGVDGSIFVSSRIISFESTGFTVDDVGADAHPNKNGQIYNYLCLG